MEQRSGNISPTRPIQKVKGTCGVCFSEWKLHHKNGLVHKHGPRDNPCLGSHKPPMILPCPAVLPDATLIQNRGPTGDPGPPRAAARSEPAQVVIPHPYLQTRLIKHIPKAARHSLCGLLTTIIGRILQDPDALLPWQHLLAFGALTLARPTRGGRRHNLSSKIKTRASEFFERVPDEVQTLFTPCESSALGGRGVMSREQTIAAAVSAKLEDGNIRAAARILCSDDRPVQINETTLEELRLKHPAPLQTDHPYQFRP